MAIYERIADVPRRRYRVTSPVTLEPIGEFECCQRRGRARARVERARKAQASWARAQRDASAPRTCGASSTSS